MTLNSVVLPAPFGPISPVIDPVRDLERRAVDGVKAAEMLVQILDDDHPFSPVPPVSPACGPCRGRSSCGNGPGLCPGRSASVNAISGSAELDGFVLAALDLELS